MTNHNKILYAFILLLGIFISPQSNGQNQAMADSLVIVFNNDPVDSLKNDILFDIVRYHTDQDSTIYYSNLLIEHASIDSQIIFLYRANLNIGHAYQRKGELEQALTSYLLAGKLARKINRISGIAASYIAIGDVYSASLNRDNALLYYNRAIDMLRTPTDSVTLAVALMNAGATYSQYDILDTAIMYFQESGEIFRLQKYELGTAYTIGNVGVVYAKQGETELAEKRLNEAIHMLEKHGDNYGISEFYNEMATIYHDKADLPRALSYAMNSLQLAEDGGLKEQIIAASLKLSELYEQTKDYENAYKYQRQYIVFRDSLNNEEVFQNLADLRTEYEVSQKQIEVDLLEQQKRTQEIIGYALTAVLLLIIILAIVLYLTARQRQLTNTLLARQKHIVETQRDLLDGLNKTKDRFFSIISHDLRGPVNAFAGVAELIRHYVKDKAYDDLVEVTDHIDQSSSQLSALLDNLLNWAVSQQGEIPYAPEQVNISEITTELQGVFQNMSSAKNIELDFKVAPDVSAFVDRNSAMTILRNLVSNALKFTENEGIITLSAITDQDQTIVKVQDTGVGIPQEKLSTLFELLEKKSTWGTKGEKGLGLGLQLAHEFTAMNKGSISVESEVGVGTTFTVVLPSKES